MSSYQYCKSKCGDNIPLQLCCLHNGISYTDEISNQGSEFQTETLRNASNHIFMNPYTIGYVQDCCNSIANAMELQQSCTKPLVYGKQDVNHIWQQS